MNEEEKRTPKEPEEPKEPRADQSEFLIRMIMRNAAYVNKCLNNMSYGDRENAVLYLAGYIAGRVHQVEMEKEE